MNKVINDKRNPHWSRLEDVVETLSEELMNLAEFYFDKESIASLCKDKNEVSVGTLNVSKACLEVIQSVIIVTATMYSIIKKQSTDNIEGSCTENYGVDGTVMRRETRMADDTKKEYGNNLEPILCLLEVAVSQMRNAVNNKDKKEEVKEDNINVKPKAVKRSDLSKYKHSYKRTSNTNRK